MPTLRLSTRASHLARSQSQWVAERLQQAHPGLEVRIEPRKSEGDRLIGVPLHQVGGKGLFTREIDAAVLADEADFAVHSLKDLPTESAEGLVLAAVPVRAPSGDALALPAAQSLAELPVNTEIGCGSLRRQAQILRLRPDLRMRPMRGNIETRLTKTKTWHLGGTVLAEAGLLRLELGVEWIPLPELLPAAGQGALALVCRADDAPTRAFLAGIEDPGARAEAEAERAFLRRLEAGCHAPAGIRSKWDGEMLRLEGAVFRPDGTAEARSSVEGRVADAATLGAMLADRILAAGGAEILSSCPPGAAT